MCGSSLATAVRTSVMCIIVNSISEIGVSQINPCVNYEMLVFSLLHWQIMFKHVRATQMPTCILHPVDELPTLDLERKVIYEFTLQYYN